MVGLQQRGAQFGSRRALASGTDGTTWNIAIRTLAALLALVVAGGLVFSWRGEIDKIEEAEEDVVAMQIINNRLALYRAHADEVTLRMLGPLDLADQSTVNAATMHRTDTVREVTDQLTALQASSRVHASQIDLLLSEIVDFMPDAAGADLADLDYSAYAAIYEGGSEPVDNPSELESIVELMWADNALSSSLHFALYLAYQERSIEPTLDQQLYFDSIASSASYGGLSRLGPDPDDPFVNTWVYADLIAVHEEPALTAITDLVVETDLWEASDWLAAVADQLFEANSGEATLSEGTTGQATAFDDPPAIEVLAPRTVLDIEGVRGIVDDRVQELNDEADDALSAAESGAAMRLYGALAMVGLAVALFCWSAVAGWKRSRLLADMANNDSLTGVGNRNALEFATAGRLSDPRLQHHLLVTIDMDRFKLANDTFGHNFGDRLLVRLAEGLKRVAASAEADEFTVIRLGGDEFLISLHSVQPLDRVKLERQLNALRQVRLQVTSKVEWPLEFSYGIATGTGSPDLQELLDESDIAVYAQKAARREEPLVPLVADVVDITHR